MNRAATPVSVWALLKLLKRGGSAFIYAVYFPPIGPIIEAVLMTQPNLQ